MVGEQQHIGLSHHRRAGGQSQHSELLTLSPKSDHIQNAIAYSEKHLRTELSVGKLAQVANLSPRHFSRALQKETGQSPAKAAEKLRLESARLMIEQNLQDLLILAGCVRLFRERLVCPRKPFAARPAQRRLSLSGVHQRMMRSAGRTNR
jgi:AraC-like DNA-binding protein